MTRSYAIKLFKAKLYLWHRRIPVWHDWRYRIRT